MERLILSKFDPLAGQEAPGVTIEIVAELPEMDDHEGFYNIQAAHLVHVLKNNLPQGTLFRVLLKLMESYSKDTLYRGKHGT